MDEDFRLETERLRLRRYRREDLEDLHAMFSDPEHMRWYPEPFPREGTQEWLDRQIAGYRDRGWALLIVEDRETGEFLGTAGPALLLVEGVEEVEIGWHTRPGRKGEGIMPIFSATRPDGRFSGRTSEITWSTSRFANAQSRAAAPASGVQVDREVDHKGLRHHVYRIDRVTWEERGGGATP